MTQKEQRARAECTINKLNVSIVSPQSFYTHFQREKNRQKPYWAKFNRQEPITNDKDRQTHTQQV